MIFPWPVYLLSAMLAAALLIENPSLHHGGWFMYICLFANLQCAYREWRNP